MDILRSLDKTLPIPQQIAFVLEHIKELEDKQGMDAGHQFEGFIKQVQNAVRVCDSMSRNTNQHAESIDLEVSPTSACSIEGLYFMKKLLKAAGGMNYFIHPPESKSLEIRVGATQLNMQAAEEALMKAGVIQPDPDAEEKMTLFAN